MKYKLRIRCEIQQTDDYGSYQGHGLTVEESIGLDCVSFMEIAKVLGKFHDLGEEIKAAQP